MKIKWLGQAAFVIKNNQNLVTDPFNPLVGRLPKDLTAAAVTVSHTHLDHNYTQGVGGGPQIINQAGDFTVGDFEIKGVSTFHDNANGAKRGINIVFTIRVDGLNLCHLGDLGHVLTEAQLKEIGPVDILMIPVGGHFTIGPSETVQIINQIKPKVVLPMHYKPNGSFMPWPLANVSDFIKELGWKVQEVEELEIDSKNIDSYKNQIIVFE